MLEELARREAVARQRIVEIREQIAALESRLQDEHDRLSRLVITRETVEEILGGAVEPVGDPVTAGIAGLDVNAAGAVPAGPPVLGVVTVPPWRPGMKAAMLPRAYRDAVEIMTDAGRAMRAGQIAAAMGLPDEAAKREGLRSKLKRLVERGWAREEGPGLFMVTEPVAREVSEQGDGGSRDGIAPSSASSPGG
ncbi:hypothetical protein HD597_000707 [Nonomuraea thailandensis]|uniref:Uncharacterized protein n=1 Tax=Nonomuraea thailandensis TaxID=1188745 RepID=A0A9X2G6Y3_9ACTN|nr:hypothetical protein [Nonomuraea thailandensis]MCP2353687.1 hypothetical protein [Nonomuraea thailandensis]